MSSGLFDKFKIWYEKRHEYAIDWKARTGGSVVATMCTYVPEEVLIAAGMASTRRMASRWRQSLWPTTMPAGWR